MRALHLMCVASIYGFSATALYANQEKLEPTSPLRMNTPDMQEYDAALTRKIRSQIVNNKKLSKDAHRVKVVTMNNEIIIKGPVSSEEERLLIETTAKELAGNYTVVNETFVEQEEPR